MDTLQAIKERRAIKNFDPGHKLTKEEERKLFEHTILAPTSYNLQHWRFVIVRDPSLRKQIRAVAFDQDKVEDASLLIVLCADLKTWERNPEKYWKYAPKEIQDFIIPSIKPFYEGKESLQRDEAMRSVGIAAQTLMLTAKAMGYDSCPMIGFESEKVAQLINLPENHLVGMMVTVGKAVRPIWPKPGQLPLEKVLFEDSF